MASKQKILEYITQKRRENKTMLSSKKLRGDETMLYNFILGKIKAMDEIEEEILK